VDNPFIKVDEDELGDTVIVESGQDRGDDFKVVNLGDDGTSVLTTEGPVDASEEDVDLEDANGIDFEGDSFYGDLMTSFPIDRTVIKLTGNAGRSAARCLDVSGAVNAGVERNEDGSLILNDNGSLNINQGLVEKYPGNDDDTYVPPRFARDGQLRPDVGSDGVDPRAETLPDVGETDGQEVSILLQRLSEVREDYSGRAYWTTVLGRMSTDEEFEPIEPTDEYDIDQALWDATHWMEWSFPDQAEIESAQAEQTGSGAGGSVTESA